jgi:hypothetical protein
MTRISAIHQSLTGFVCGIIALVPVIGLLPGLYAIICWSRVRRLYRNQWNPASGYLKSGAILGSLGAISSALMIFMIGLATINNGH